MHALKQPRFQDQESKWIPVRTKEKTKDMVIEASSTVCKLLNNMFDALNLETIMFEMEQDEDQSSMDILEGRQKNCQ